MSGRRGLALAVAAIGGIGCGSSLQSPSPDASDGPCTGFQTFPATPVAPDAGGAPCTVQLPRSNDCSGGPVVRLANGEAVYQDPQNGWSYADMYMTTIQFGGPACDEITAGHVSTVCIEWECLSDRAAKRDFAPVDRDAILDRLSRLPLSTWSYKSDAQRARHIGPMAQDFKLTFDVGANDKTIFPLDESGVAFAAIQALDARLRRLEDENARLRREIATLRARARRR